MESDQIWNQVAKFMQQLRGENLSKKSIIQIPGQKNAKNELEKIQAIGKERMKHMKETEQRITQKWIECLEDNASLEAQQAYCQGYIDCLFLLCGMGNDIFEQLNIRAKIKYQNCLCECHRLIGQLL